MRSIWVVVAALAATVGPAPAAHAAVGVAPDGALGAAVALSPPGERASAPLVGRRRGLPPSVATR
ncbi:MAG: hypothetical protein Q8K79_18630 [Solirubrobacteraceae bacterium]|nr:hypothetical protein [Solirubrobacteraceae bacterium]